MTAENPLLAPFEGPYALPPFDRVETAHFLPAFEAALAEHRAQIDAIKADPAPADFANTILAMERSGRTLGRVNSVFWTLVGGSMTPELEAVQTEVAPMLARHSSAIMLDAELWARVKAVPEAGLGAEEARILELTKRGFRKAGADLEGAARARAGEIKARLAELSTAFGQRVLKDEQGWAMALGPEDLGGLSESLVAAAEAEGRARGLDGPAITLSRSSVEPFLASSTRRDLRERAWRAWTARGEPANWAVIEETLALRREFAELMGKRSYAEHSLADQMAKTPEAVRELLMNVWRPARAKAEAEAADLAAMAQEDGVERLAPWDWRFYAERLRRARYAVDDAEIKPYLTLDAMIEAAFETANRLFGLEFSEVEGLALPASDARAWQVRREGRTIGLFIGDYHARPSKRSGAWASSLAAQQKLWEPGLPVIQNTLNLSKGAPTLLSFDDARTLFHEFGHALHGLLSDVTYPSISGTRVARDFVELPSQLYEHWLSVPEILTRFARHYRTGAPMPADLIARIEASETFNQGFVTVEYLGSAIVDLEMHALEDVEGLDAKAFEAEVLARIGMPDAIAMRHRSPHFLHVFAGGYAAGYYSYMWSEVMDADAFAAFEETGDPFDAETARKLEAHVLSAGAKVEPEDAYGGFRGRMPGLEPLLAGRGLLAEVTA